MIPGKLDSIRELSQLLHKILLKTSALIVPGSEYKSLYSEALALIKQHCPDADIYYFDLNINETVCHGSSRKRKVENGDIVTLDIVICRDGLFADEAWSSLCGDSIPEYKDLLSMAWEISRKAVLSIEPGDTSLSMKKEIHNLLRGSSYSLLDEACGHGIGLEMHMPPDINFSLLNKEDITWREGMIFTIEPVISMDGAKLIQSKEKEWITDNGKVSAYFEHMVAINSTRAECLNLPEINNQNSIDIFQQII